MIIKLLLIGLLIGALGIVEIFGKLVGNIILKPGERYQFKNPSFPDTDNDVVLKWNFKIEGDGKIKFVCKDIRMAQVPEWSQDCQFVSLSVLEDKKETKVCNSTIKNFVYKSNGKNIQIKLKAEKRGHGIFQCTALNTADLPDAEQIYLNSDGRIKQIRIDTYGNPQPNLDKQWKYESPEGTRISAQCQFGMVGSMKPLCGEDVVIFDDGEMDHEICNNTKHDWFSIKNKMGLRLQFSKFGHGNMLCTIQAVTGPNVNQYENLVASPEVDSSEHGVTSGVRQTSCDCGRANKDLARIVYGNETGQNEFPWMVQVITTSDKNAGERTCGGTIITSRHVLTAAHCVVRNRKLLPPERIKVHLAKHYYYSKNKHLIIVESKKIFVKDRNLIKGDAYDDIAVIFTKQTMDFSNRLVGPICIEPNGYDIFHKRLIVLGWGVTETNQYSDYLRRGKVRIIDNKFCHGFDWDICTGLAPSNVCSGDSGGPYVLLDPETNRYTQIALTSRDQGHVRCRERSIGTLVAYYYKWIQEVIEETEPNFFLWETILRCKRRGKLRNGVILQQDNPRPHSAKRAEDMIKLGIRSAGTPTIQFRPGSKRFSYVWTIKGSAKGKKICK